MYEVFKSDANGKFYFRLKAANGEIILASQAYDAKASALNGIESVKTNAPDPSRYDKKQLANGKWHFVLKAANGLVIGQSQQYDTEASAVNGEASVMKNAGGPIKDLAE